MTLHSILILRSKKNPKEYTFSPHTLSGDDVLERKEGIVELHVRSWANDWEFVYAKEKVVFEKDWSINLNSQDFNLIIEDDSIFNRPINFEALASLHPILDFFRD